MSDYLNHPVILTTEPVSLAERGTATSDTTRMSNKIRIPMLIDRVSFLLRSPEDILARFDIAPSIRVKLTVGPWSLSNNLIPVWSYCAQNQDRQRYAGQTGAYVASELLNYSRYVWKLPKPLFVPPNMPFTADWFRSADGMGGSATAEISFTGRTFKEDQRPVEIDVPFVAGWVGTIGQASERSGQNDIRNALDKPLHVQRLIGRILLSSVPTYYGETRLATYLSTGILCRIYDSHLPVRELVQTSTLFSDVFEQSRRAWNIGMELGAGQSIYVEATGVPASHAVHVSMVGTRKESPPWA